MEIPQISEGKGVVLGLNIPLEASTDGTITGQIPYSLSFGFGDGLGSAINIGLTNDLHITGDIIIGVRIGHFFSASPSISDSW